MINQEPSGTPAAPPDSLDDSDRDKPDRLGVKCALFMRVETVFGVIKADNANLLEWR